MSEIYRHLDKEEFDDITTRILYEDNHLLIFNKRSGEIVQGDKTEDEPLPEKLKAYIAQRDNKPSRVFMGVPHRLDRPVSGIVVLAKTSKALQRMSEQFRDGEVSKFYWALVEKSPEPEQGEIKSYLLRNEKQNKSYIVPEGTANAKLAILDYKLIGRSAGGYSLLEVELHTGRHHQIRTQLAGIGCPIRGDLKYGYQRSNTDGSISLHARKLSFIHPIKKELIELEADVPNTDNLWKAFDL